MRRIVSVLLALSVVASVPAQEVITGKLKVAFGHAKQADGSYKDLTGMELPFKAEKIKTSEINPYKWRLKQLQNWMAGYQPPVAGGGSTTEALQPIYLADHQALLINAPYGVIGEQDSPSVLDDISPLSGSVGKQWVNLMFAFDTPVASPQFLIRWTLFSSFTAGRGAGVSAVNPWPISPTYPLDFGVIWNQAVPIGTYKVTISVASAGVSAPTNTFWFAQQFREVTTPVNPDADFDNRIRNVFNQEAPPQIGASSINFWLDEPADGLYDETEVDIFGSVENPQQGNLLLGIEANTTGSISEVTPLFLSQNIGANTSGNIVSVLFENDSDVYSSNMDWNGARQNPASEVELTGFSPSATIDAYGSNLRVGCVSGSGNIRLQYYRYGGASPGWVTVKTIPVTGGLVNSLHFWTAGNPSEFVHPTSRQIKMRIGMFPGNTSRTFQMQIDKATWTIGRP